MKVVQFEVIYHHGKLGDIWSSRSDFSYFISLIWFDKLKEQ
jgi:hypothetical protein